MAEQETVTLVSMRDERGQAALDTTKLVVDGVTLNFRSGQARDVPVDLAERLISRRKDLYVQEWGLAGRPSTAAASAQQAPTGPGVATPAPAMTEEELAAHLAEEAEELGEDTAPPPPIEEDDSVGTEPPPSEQSVAGQVKVIPQGFEAFTGDGQPRCLAAKADGSQCSNAVKDATSACGLAAHQQVVEQLPDATVAPPA